MARATFQDIRYAISHPLRACRYLRHRDTIAYDICARYLPANPIIIEAGAYDGANSQDFCRYWPSCQVYAFEPVPSAYERLTVASEKFPRQIHPQNVALSNKEGASEMHVSATYSAGGEQSSSLLTPTATREEFPFVGFLEETITVRVTRLDQWAASRNLTHLDFLWLDLQGMELAALAGCGNLLSTVRAIHCEVQNIPLYAGAPLYPEISQWLQSRGFRVAQEAVFRRGGNVLFVASR